MSNTPLPDPYGQITTHTLRDQQFFYRWPDPPYLDNAKECIRVYTREHMHAHAAAVSAERDARIKVLEDALRAIDKQCFSHVDGRDLFAQMHPRNTLDIKRRVDARETWFEGDWLTDLWTAIKAARAAQGEKP